MEKINLETNSLVNNLSETITTPRKKDDFYILAELGEGSYSTVYLASEKTSSNKFAIKVCSKRKIQREKKVHQIFRERDILRLLSTPEHSHPFITRLYCTFQDSDCLYFVLTLAEKKDLLARLKASGGCLDLEKTRFVMAELCSALLHIHGLNVVHRDVKPENILLRKNGHILLSDFGCAKLIDESTNSNENNNINTNKDVEESQQSPEERRRSKEKRRCSFVGTAQYVSPEMLNGEPSTPACDWWSFGIILFELLSGQRPFNGETEFLLFQQILKLNYKFPSNFPSEEAKYLIEQILILNKNKRINGLKIKENEFFKEINWEILTKFKSPLFDVNED
uniref:non-specific serine/threonine protein kinase n=1 Tax=Meloidogyne enterolobii TaxID=390850 RepID=A0A6V7UQL2_MELEN|nr:unnamed protein product [Meloidogyne enterolobii]